MEKFADVRIADHARKDAPNGSVSWKYIEDSVKEGELRNINEYTKASGLSQRPVGSTQPAKATRNKFTVEEDQLLGSWVLKQEHLGEKLGGNKIYQLFAETVRPRYYSIRNTANGVSTQLIHGNRGKTVG
jgi:hypothetical protein